MEIPVYLFTGFYGSGKTTLIKDTLFDSGFNEGNKTLLIVCEDGEVEYTHEECYKNNVVLSMIEEEEEFTKEKLEELYRQYMPDNVFIEYNGTWQIATFTDTELPDDWSLVQVLTTVEGPTFEMYLGNMASMMMDQMFLSDVIIINRSNDELPKRKFRAAIKANNKKAQIVYEREDGSIDENAMNELPYDKSEDYLELTDADYAAFYMDAMDNPKDYDGKTVKFRALVYRPENYKRPGFVPGRFAMTCCVEDIQFLGLVCKSDRASEVKHKSWIDITAKIKYEFNKDYSGKGPVLYEEKIEQAEKPEDELVYFT